MLHLTVTNFGPIKEFSGDVARVNLLIGPQASGKSTIAKLLYYFQMLPVKLATFDPAGSSGNYYNQYLKILKSYFLGLFGHVYRQPGLSIVYKFTVPDTDYRHSDTYYEHKVQITHKQTSSNANYLVIRFDRRLKEELENLLDDIVEFRNKDPQRLINSHMSRHQDEEAWKNIQIKVETLFGEQNSSIFIPAGRSLITQLSGQVKNFNSADPIMDDFLESINGLRPLAGRGLDEIEEHARQAKLLRSSTRTRAELARGEIQKILRGRYAFANGEERIYHDSGYTKLSVASSGQQESLWVTLTAYIMILEQDPIFAFFEEPEAHLYPESQYAIIRLMALLVNAHPSNRVLITTHSPYVLVSLNNLLTANRLRNKHFPRVQKIIQRQFYLDISELKAYAFSDDGRAHSIIDQKTGLIKAEAIDSASGIMNDEYDRMMDLEFGEAGR